MKCHGCNGKGWVDSKVTGATICPVCKGRGSIRYNATEESIDTVDHKPPKSRKYDQDAVWISLREGLPISFNEKLKMESDRMQKEIGENDKVLVHLLFDREVTTQGNLIFHHLQNQTITGPKQARMQCDGVLARGYSIDDKGDIRTHMDVPVSPIIFDIIQWCSNDERVKDFTLDPNRKGNPCFCDENMLAMIIVPMTNSIYGLLSDMFSFLFSIHPVKVINVSLHLLQ